MTEYLLLGKSEEEFWESTPRKVLALIDQKNKIEKVRQKNQAIYIACYVWGKDPAEFENQETSGPVPGRDVPIDENMLRFLG